jgi:hypothetical protein
MVSTTGEEVSDAMGPPLSLREMLLRDFGVDLPIKGGFGRKESPIIVIAKDLQSAVDIQREVLRCLGLGRRVVWRFLEHEVHLPDGTVRAGIETVSLTDTEVLTTREAYYFVFNALTPLVAILPVASGCTDPRSGLRLPCQLGWLHYESTIDNEVRQPGLGMSVAYSVFGIKATIYIYDRRMPAIPDDVRSDVVVGEYETAVRDALAANSDRHAKVVDQGFMGGADVSPRALLGILELEAPRMSAVLMTSYEGYFVKARVTWDASEARLHEIALDSIGAIVDAIRPADHLARSPLV